MKLAKEQDRERILEYLREGLSDCIYLYIDIMNYGISSENMKVWIREQDKKITLVVMKYYDSFQIYSASDECDVEAVKQLLKEYPVAMVSGKKSIIELLEGQCSEYKASYGAVFVLDKFCNINSEVGVETASSEDTYEIAQLICSDDEIGGHYTVENLTAQLSERIESGTGRSYFIRENGKVVAHTATYAEADGVAVVGGTIVEPESRNKNYYLILSNYMLKQLEKEKKQAYTFSLSDKMIQYHTRMHTKCGEYGKMVRK